MPICPASTRPTCTRSPICATRAGTSSTVPAITEIDRAINEAKRAAAEDGKNLANHPAEDARLDHPGRLHHALEFLRKAKADVRQEEDNPEARRLRNAVVVHIDRAIQATQRAIRAVERHK